MHFTFCEMLLAVTWQPLGEYEVFRRWGGKARSWGPDGRCRIWFGGEVIDGLAQVIDEHVAAEGRRRETASAALGCVPWLTHQGIAARLARLSACCVVVDKGRRQLASALATADNGFPNVCPVCATGCRTQTAMRQCSASTARCPSTRSAPCAPWVWRVTGAAKPLLQAKLLVLGRLRWPEIGPYEGPTEEVLKFEPQSVWWGSANWTETSRSHLELGAGGRRFPRLPDRLLGAAAIRVSRATARASRGRLGRGSDA